MKPLMAETEILRGRLRPQELSAGQYSTLHDQGIPNRSELGGCGQIIADGMMKGLWPDPKPCVAAPTAASISGSIVSWGDIWITCECEIKPSAGLASAKVLLEEPACIPQ